MYCFINKNLYYIQNMQTYQYIKHILKDRFSMYLIKYHHICLNHMKIHIHSVKNTLMLDRKCSYQHEGLYMFNRKDYSFNIRIGSCLCKYLQGILLDICCYYRGMIIPYKIDNYRYFYRCSPIFFFIIVVLCFFIFGCFFLKQIYIYIAFFKLYFSFFFY